MLVAGKQRLRIGVCSFHPYAHGRCNMSTINRRRRPSAWCAETPIFRKQVGLADQQDLLILPALARVGRLLLLSFPLSLPIRLFHPFHFLKLGPRLPLF
jgi:hypothetical protein